MGEEKTNVVESLFEKIEEYSKVAFKLFMYRALEKSSVVVSGIITRLILFVIFLIFFLFLNIAIGFLLGSILGKAWYGFGILAGFYLIAGLLVLVLNKSLKKLFANLVIREVLGNSESD